jgi:hypothetical protein
MHDIEVYDLYDVWYQPWWLSTPAKIVWAILGVIIVCLLVWLCIRLIRANTKISYVQKALQQCAYLRKNADTLELAFVYAQLTALLKDYIERRYQVRLKPFTDQEVVVQVNQLPLSAAQKDMAYQILTYAVPAKFDAYQDAISDPTIHIGLLEAFIKQTSVPEKPKTVTV